MNVKNKIQRSFNRAADSYDDNCHAQLRAGIKLTHLIKSCQPHAERIIDLGCGTGITTQIIASQYCFQEFHAIDISTSLLMKAHHRLSQLKINVYEMDFENITNNNYLPFDIIYSNMALQWSSNILNTLTMLRGLLTDNGNLAFSLPLSGTFRELQHHYAINHFPDINIIQQYLISAGYRILISEAENIRLTFPHVVHALKSIKQTGANYACHRIHKGLNGKSHLKQINSNELTYEIGYFIASKT